MNRSELIRLIVLNEICDDYENVDQRIFPGVAKEGAECGLTIERSDVLVALAGLIEDGLAKAYLLSSREPYAAELQGIPSMDVIEEDFKTYFYITKKGMELHLSCDGQWPQLEQGR